MDNPWSQLPKRFPYVLPADAAAVEQFNKGAGPNHFLHTEKRPEPYIGDPTAPVVLLNLNGGYREDDDQFTVHPVARTLQLGNLRHAPADYPFYHLDPRIKAFGGWKWWTDHLDALICRVGVKVVANRVFCVEFFPYSSRKYRSMRGILDSQRYGFHLVEQAIDRGALIVLLRSRREWCENVQGLASYDRLYECTSPQNSTISLRSLPVAFPEIVRAVRA